MKANCYKCKYRGTVAGSAHSCCEHPSIKKTPLGEVFGILASVGRCPVPPVETKITVKGNPHGIKSGWFAWPFNFDPIWLENCDGFTQKKIKENS